MLVLTRKRTEMIKIGEDIVITVVHTSRGSVKLGIQAPTHVRVLRAELGQRPAALDATECSACGDHSLESPIFSADQFPQGFDADYVADLEDQVLLCMTN